MEYIEDINNIVCKHYRQEYLEGLEKLIFSREKEFSKLRDFVAKQIFENPETMRKSFKDMLGWPLNAIESIEMKGVPTQEKLFDGKNYDIYRMQFEILEGIKLYGLLFKMKSEKARPLVIAQSGALGTPEVISGIYGDSSNYNDMVERVLKYNVHVFAPQLLLWDEDKYDVKFDRVKIDSQLKRVGSSITAIEVFGIQKIIDYFEKEAYVTNIGMIGLSYGSFYTLFTAACDTRIKSSVACSQFNDRAKNIFVDWTWNNAALMFSDAEIACLVYPRHLCIEVGDNDEAFSYEDAKNEFNRLIKHCEGHSTDWVDFIVFSGNHEFHKDDMPIERLVNDIQ